MARSQKSKEDPTGQGNNRLRAFRSIRNRLNKAQRQTMALFKQIPKKRRTKVRIVNAESIPVYDYDITPEERADLALKVEAILNAELETERALIPEDWFFKPFVETPYRQGTLEEVNHFNQMIAAALLAGLFKKRPLPPQPVPPDMILRSPAYLQALDDVYVTNYENIKSLSRGTARQVTQRINAGIASGKSPSKIAADIVDRFDVSHSSAQRLAVTTVNEAYTNSKMNATVMAAKESGLRAGVIHISVLLATTRQTHAARHGNAYTVEDQKLWWDQGANRINCHCSIQSVLIDRKGRVVQKEAQDEFKAEKTNFR